MRRIIFYSLFTVLFFISASISGAVQIPTGFPDSSDAFPPPEVSLTVLGAASRTEGVAPLSVFFNANLTASTATNRSFHDLDYKWSFGDSAAGNWPYSGVSKDEAKGAVASHVYETAGTYTATLVVRDSGGNVVTEKGETYTITVKDPDVIFSGTATTCISTNTDFTGCPADARKITTSDISDLFDYTGQNKRLLFHRGSSWSIISNISWGWRDSPGDPAIIGAYGSCTSPDELGICSNAPLITIDATNISFFTVTYKVNYRIMDLSIDVPGDNTATYMLYGKQGVKQFLGLRLKSDGAYIGMNIGAYRKNDADYQDDITITSCSITDTDRQNIYIGSERLSITGNHLFDSRYSHDLRVWLSYLGVVSHNKISGTTLLTDQGKHALKLHGPQESQVGTYAETGSSGVRNRSEFNMVSNNIFGRSGPWTVSIGPEGATYDERITDLIFEKNKVIADYGIQSIGSSLVQVGTMAEGRYMSLRNNIFDGTGGTTGYIGLYISRRGVEPPPDYCSVYNNTIYRSETATTASGNIGVKIGSSATNTLVRNNYASFPNITGTVEVVVDDSGVSTMSDNVYTRTPYFIAPDNVDPLQRDFHTTQVTGTGYTVPLLDDFDGKSRIADDTYDIGAYEY